MKTLKAMLAIGAMFAAVGCGGTEGPGKVGTNTEALTTTDTVEAPSSCVIRDISASPVKDYLLVAAGQTDSTPTYSRNWKLYDPSLATGSQQVLSGTFGSSGDERAYAQMVQLPGNLNKCLLAGGIGASSSPKQAHLFTLSHGPLAITTAQAGALNTGREKFALAPCSNGDVVAIGGIDVKNGGGATLSSVIERYSGQTTTTAWNTGATLSSPVYEFGFFADGANDHFLLAGGNLGGTKSRRVTVITKTTNCGDTQTLLADNDTHRLTAGVQGNVLIPEGSANKFLSVAGKTTSLPTTADVLTVDFTTSANWVVSQGTGPALPTGVHLPAVVKDPNHATDHYLLVGGDDSVQTLPITYAGNTVASANVQTFILGASSTTGSWAQTATLDGQRVTNFAEYLPTFAGGAALTGAGMSLSSGTPTRLNTMELLP